MKTHPKRAPRSADSGKNALQRQRGFRRVERLGRPKPYGVRWREKETDAATGLPRWKHRAEFFTTATDRDRRLADLARQKREGQLVTIPHAEIEDWRAFKRATEGTPWTEVVAGWHAARSSAGNPVKSPLVKDQVKDHMARLTNLQKKGEVSNGTLRQRKHKLGLFAGTFGDRTIASLRGDELEVWIDSLGFDSPHSFNAVRKNVRALFSEAVRLDLLRKNPCDAVNKRAEGLHEVGIISPEECATLFKTGLGSPGHRAMIPRLALEAFAGLRFATACRVVKADLRREDKGILLPAIKMKDKRRHYIDGLPGNLWAWLDLATEATWTMTARTYLELKSSLFRLAEVPHPHNALRHSFASHHVAAFKKPGLTATLLCHGSEKKLWSNYKGNATEAEGKRWWEITPLSCGATKAAGPPRA